MEIREQGWAAAAWFEPPASDCAAPGRGRADGAERELGTDGYRLAITRLGPPEPSRQAINPM
jgi:hypothetical protein